MTREPLNVKEKISSRRAKDGTKLVLKRIEREGYEDEDEYIVTEAGSDNRIDQIERSRADGRVQLKNSVKFYNTAAEQKQKRQNSGFGFGSGGGRSERRGRSDGFGGGGMDAGLGGGGGLFGGGNDSDRGRSSDGMDMDGGLFGGGGGGGLFGGGGDRKRKKKKSDSSDDSGGLFGGFGGGLFSGGGGGATRRRDADSGRFAPTRSREADFEMERDSNGRFKGRADDDDSGGLFDMFRR